MKAALLVKRNTDEPVSEEPLISNETPPDPVRALAEGWDYCLTTEEPPEGLAGRLPELFDPSVRLDFSERIFNPSVYEGHEGVRQWRTELAEVWESFRADPQELFRGEDVFVVFVAEVSTGPAEGHRGHARDGADVQDPSQSDRRVALLRGPHSGAARGGPRARRRDRCLKLFRAPF